MENLIQFCIDNINYWTITVFMAIESSFIPFPSEVVVPPAGYLAAEPNSNLNIFFVVLFSTLGSLIGASINYCLAYFLGRPIVYKFVNSKVGHMCLLSEANLNKAEKYFNENGAISTFIGRLIPGIRQLISIPAGLVKMSFPKFLLYTGMGAGIWNTILAIIGYGLHETVGNVKDIPDIAKGKGLTISVILVAILIIIGVIYYLKKKKANKDKEQETIEKETEQDQIENV